MGRRRTMSARAALPSAWQWVRLPWISILAEDSSVCILSYSSLPPCNWMKLLQIVSRALLSSLLAAVVTAAPMVWVGMLFSICTPIMMSCTYRDEIIYFKVILNGSHKSPDLKWVTIHSWIFVVGNRHHGKDRNICSFIWILGNTGTFVGSESLWEL